MWQIMYAQMPKPNAKFAASLSLTHSKVHERDK